MRNKEWYGYKKYKYKIKRKELTVNNFSDDLLWGHFYIFADREFRF